MESQEVVNPGNIPQEKKAANTQIEQLAKQVEQAKMDEMVKVTHLDGG